MAGIGDNSGDPTSSLPDNSPEVALGVQIQHNIPDEVSKRPAIARLLEAAGIDPNSRINLLIVPKDAAAAAELQNYGDTTLNYMTYKTLRPLLLVLQGKASCSLPRECY